MTQKKLRVKKGDIVEVVTGRYKGRKGTIQKVFLEESKVIVDGVNVVVRHTKPNMDNPSGKIAKTLPIHVSNISLVDPSTNKPGKVGYKIEDGNKVRFFKKTGVPVS